MSVASASMTAPRLAGPLLMLAASALIAVTSLIAKMLGQDGFGPPLHPLQVSAGRFVFAWCTLVPVMLAMRPGFAGASWSLHVGRTLCGWGGVSCMFAAAARMPLADATAISFLAPMVSMVLAVVILAERVGPWRWGAAAIALAGALLLIRPGTEAFRPVALVALASAALMGLEMVLIKRLSGREPPIRILFVNNSIGAAVGLSAASFVWIWPTPEQWPLLVALGMVMVTAQTCFVQAMKRGDASYVAPFFYATLVFASLYDLVLFGVIPVPLSIAGAALVLTGAIVLAWRENRRPAPAPVAAPD
ncbi:MAG: DMT family transporter [Pseudomonadota bacterium]|nr:DMT family transporter [Pseudomonadota bacterium]